MTLSQERILATEIPGPRSQALQARKVATVSAGVGTTLPVYVEQAGGGILRDVDGNQLIDFGSGIAVTTVGNAAPRVVESVQRQVADFTHTCFIVTPYEEYVAVCEKLAALTPGSHEKRSALFNSGAEAVENAVKVARHHTGRDAVVVFDHAYHGRTNLTMALTAKNMPYKHGFGPFAGEIYRAPMAYPYRWPSGPEACADEAFDAFVATVHAQVGEDSCAAVLVEPIQGEGGFIVPPEGWLRSVAEFCKEHGILLIADEVICGFCRTGEMFGSTTFGLKPDILTAAKALSSGYAPISAVMVSERIHAAIAGNSGRIGTFGHGFTYSGHPVSCAIALETLRVYEDEGILARVKSLAPRFQAGLRRYAERPRVGEVRGIGLIGAIELAEDPAARKTFDPNLKMGTRLAELALQEGLIVRAMGDSVAFCPPLIITATQVDEIFDRFDRAMLRFEETVQ